MKYTYISNISLIEIDIIDAFGHIPLIQQMFSATDSDRLASNAGMMVLLLLPC